MTVRTRLVATFGVLTLLLVLPALYAASRLGTLRDLAVEGRQDHARVALALGRMATTRAELERLQRNRVVDARAAAELGDTPDTALAADLAASRRRLAGHVAWLTESRYGAASARLGPVVSALRERSGVIDSLIAAGLLDAAADSLGSLETHFLRMDAGLQVLADSVGALAGRDFDRARAISTAARNGTLLALAGALGLALLLGWWTTLVLTGPLRDLVEATGSVTGGSLDPPTDLPYEREDEIGDLSRAFRSMTNRLAELDRLKAEFMGVASHELKTPINVIRGYTELIEENIAGEVTEQQAEILGAIAEQTRVMSRLVGRLMDISRLETGTYLMEIEAVHTEDLVTGVLRSFDVLAAEKEIELAAEVEPSAPEIIEVDVDLVRDEVLGNLVSNAVKHTPTGGRIDLRVLGEGDDVVFEVADTGPGIPPEDREHIFEKYYQVKRSRKVGTGLGLAVAKEMVEAHGGRIELVPDAPRGATFRVRLPVVSGEVREPEIAKGSAVTAAGEPAKTPG